MSATKIQLSLTPLEIEALLVAWGIEEGMVRDPALRAAYDTAFAKLEVAKAPTEESP